MCPGVHIGGTPQAARHQPASGELQDYVQPANHRSAMNARKIVMLSIATVPFLFVPSAFAQQIVAAGSTVKFM